MKFSTYVLRSKWAVIGLVALFLVVFARTVNSPSLTKSAIIIGIDIDFLEDERQFEVTAQSVLMASSAGEASSQTTYETYTDKGNTISGALDAISQKMGLTASLSHCEVVFLTRSALKLDHLQLIYPLTGMYSLREQAIVVSGDRKPSELMALRIGTTISAPYFLQSAILNQEGTDGMIRTTTKDLLARSLSRSQATAIPYISAKKMPSQPMDQQGEQKDNFELDLSKILVFDHSKSSVVENDLAEILAIYLSEATYGSLNYLYESGETVEFRILDKQVSSKAKGRTVSAKIQLAVDLLDFQHIPADKPLTGADAFIKDTAKKLGEELSSKLVKLFELSKELNVDFLGLKAKAYQSVGRDLEEDCLATLTFVPTVTLSVKEAS